MAIVVEGLAEVQTALTTAAAEMSTQLDTVCDTLAEDGLATITSQAPRRTGALIDSARTEPIDGGTAIVVGDSRVTYAAAVNYGSDRRNIQGAAFLEDAAALITSQAPDLAEASIEELLTRNGLQ